LIINTIYALKTTNKLKTIFGQITDFRRSQRKLYDLESILVIGILHDTFNRVFSNIDSNEFEKYFIQWVNTLAQLQPREIIAIDGKTIRGAKSNGKKSAVHMVSAWANDNNLVLGQVKVSEKSNEITAIPILLEALQLDDTIVTIDAMGCQRNIAETIVENNADYILAAKENQKQLYQDIKDEFNFSKQISTHLSEVVDHGRIEIRKASILTDFQFIKHQNGWKNLHTIIKIESSREFKNKDKPIERATRYYISSLKADAIDFQKAIREHWGIENKLHWTLDVAFSEDASRKRRNNAAQNFSIINKIALNLLKNEKTAKVGVKSKRLKAGWNNHYLIKILNLIKV